MTPKHLNTFNVFNETEIINTTNNIDDAEWLRSISVQIEQKRNKFFTSLIIGGVKDVTMSGNLKMALDAIDALFARHDLSNTKADEMKQSFRQLQIN
tara:strand:+ start:1017 stop:1307 length:291 start_codon:yes stop_codon:yes gene_type:complete